MQCFRVFYLPVDNFFVNKWGEMWGEVDNFVLLQQI